MDASSMEGVEPDETVQLRCTPYLDTDAPTGAGRCCRIVLSRANTYCPIDLLATVIVGSEGRCWAVERGNEMLSACA